MRFHPRGVFNAQNNASSDWPVRRSEREIWSVTSNSLRSAACSAVLKARGGAKRNWDGRVSTHGVMVAICGVAPEALAGGVGRQKPTAPGVPTMPRTPRNGGGGGANPSVSREAQMASATVWPQATPWEMDGAFSVDASAASDVFRRVVSAALCAGYKSTRIT